MIGGKLSEFDLPDELTVDRFYVKSPVFPFAKFPGVDPVLGPEMRSTGEVMGVAEGFGSAYLKAQQGAGTKLPREGTVFISVNDQDKRVVLDLARELHEMGFKLVATRGTQKRLEAEGLPCGFVYKVNEGRPNVDGPCEEPRGPINHQHSVGPDIVLRRALDPPRGNSILGALRDDDDWR